MSFLRKFLSLSPQEKGVTGIPFSKLAAEEERKVVIDKEDLRLAYLTNGLIFRSINTRASLTIARGFQLVYENDRVKSCIETFLKNIQKNDPHGLNFNMMMREMCIDTDVFGNGFRLLVPNQNKTKLVALKAMHPVYTDFKRDPQGKIKLDESRIPVAYTFKKETGEKIDLERDQMAHLTFNTLGDEPVGISLLTPVYNQIERLSNIEEGLAQAIHKKGYPLHEAILKSRPDWSPTEGDVEYIAGEMADIESSSQFTHTDDYEIKVHDPVFPASAMNYPTYFVDQIVAITGVPKHVLLMENITTKATAESLQRLMQPILTPLQERLATMVENQIFRRVLDKENIKGYCKIQWNEVLPERDDRLPEKINILSSTLVEGKPVITHKEVREMLGFPSEMDLKESSQLSAGPKTAAGIYLVEPHGKKIVEGRKKAIVKSKKFTEHIGVPLALVSGNYIWGKIKLDSPVEIDLKKFEEDFWKHQVTEKERIAWWPGKKKLFYYPLQILEVYKTPKFYKVPKGVQTFIRGIHL